MKPKRTLYTEQIVDSHPLWIFGMDFEPGRELVQYVVVRAINTTYPQIGDVLTEHVVNIEIQRGMSIHIKATRV